MERIIECIPNFSEGRNPLIIKEITDAIESVPGIKLLDVSSGKSANRTVVTFAGDPDLVVEAAFRGIKKAAQVIDMRKHSGVHPRFGATDVCPLVPVSHISMEETVEYARALAGRVGNELSIPVYCYEHAAFREERKSLASCRQGGYEGLKERMVSENWKPDFYNEVTPGNIDRTGAVAIGARNFLVAYNINLNTTSTRIASAIAMDVRESGRLYQDKETGKAVTGEDGNMMRIPGSLKKTRAIGWYIEDFGIAQVSMNLTDLSVTSVHQAFEEVCEKASERGVRVTGSELVGLIPLSSLLDAGKYFLEKQKRSAGIAEEELIKIAVRSLGLDELQPFDPKKKVIEYLLDEDAGKRLTDMSVSKFVTEAASEKITPGGGAISAAVGALGASLAGMVANLAAQKNDGEHRWKDFSVWAEESRQFQQDLLKLVDDDARAFLQLYTALKIPGHGNLQSSKREDEVLAASKNAIRISLNIMQKAYGSLDVIRKTLTEGNPYTVSESGVGTYCALAAVKGAFMNVKINSVYCRDDQYVQDSLNEAERLIEDAENKSREILKTTNQIISNLK